MATRPEAREDAAIANRWPGARVLPHGELWPRAGEGAWVAPGAVLVGDVALGGDASVWYGCVLRGDVHQVRVGARSNVQDGSVLHVTRGRFPTRVGEEVTIGHRAVVHGCTVGDGALVGIAAVVLDGAHIGEGALVGAGAVVTPGTRIPARARARRTGPGGAHARRRRAASPARTDPGVRAQRPPPRGGARGGAGGPHGRRVRRRTRTEEDEMAGVKVSEGVEAPAEDVWALFRDFGGWTATRAAWSAASSRVRGSAPCARW